MLNKTALGLLLSALLLTVPAAARCRTPAEAADNFFDAVAHGRHLEAWNLMTIPSQQYCILTLAGHRHITLARATALLQQDDPSTQAFWQRLETTTHADDNARLKFTSGAIYGPKGEAFAGGAFHKVVVHTVKGPDGWRFDYPASFGLK